MNAENAPVRILLFDGHCNVCDATVQWILAHDPDAKIRFAPLQGTTAARWLADAPMPDALDSVVFVVGDPSAPRILWYTDALLAVASELPAPWRWARALRWIPRPVRNGAYRLFARVRYQLFGRRDSCRLPTPEEAARFLD